MPDIAWNKATWDGTYDWTRQGEEWSDAWGGSAALWYGAILPRIAAFLPARAILEIGPGFGRWTHFLLAQCQTYRGVDLAEKCAAACRQRFAGRAGAAFFANDGKSLSVLGPEKFDFVFSFESLVHAGLDALAGYLPDIVTRLAPGGVAFLHHSNLAAYAGAQFGHRAPDVSADVVAGMVRAHGGRMLIQERVHTGGGLMPDCYTLFCRDGDYADVPTRDVTEWNVTPYALHCAQNAYRHYLAVSPRRDRPPG